MARLRSAVDNAYALDPRIIMFKTQDSEEKLAKKMEKKKAVQEKQEQEEKVVIILRLSYSCWYYVI